jgi:hypothetical protein
VYGCDGWGRGCGLDVAESMHAHTPITPRLMLHTHNSLYFSVFFTLSLSPSLPLSLSLSPPPPLSLSLPLSPSLPHPLPSLSLSPLSPLSLPPPHPPSQEYAVELAARPEVLANMRQLLREHRSKSSVFSTKAWTQGLVSVCLSVWLSA